MRKSTINRRHFLRGSGALIALPALESIGFKAFAGQKTQTPPKRLMFMGMGYGVTNETWFPAKNDVGTGYKLPLGLKNLKRHKNDFTIVQGCEHKFSRQAHWGSTYWLTGADQYGTPGQSFANTISADQVAANQFGKFTRYSSIQLNSLTAENGGGHGPGQSLAWNMHGKPMAGWDTPLIAYHKLFSADNIPLAKRQAMLAEKRSILDAVHFNAKSLQRGLTKSDTDKLDEFYQGIRDIETRLSKTEQWMTKPKPKVLFDTPDKELNGYEEIEMMYRLMVAALQNDSSRVISYRMPQRTLLASIGASISNPHVVSHYSFGVGSATEAASRKRDDAHAKLLAGLLDQLKKTKEVDGSSLFDNVTLAFGSNTRSIHYLDNCPTLLAGGGANIKLGHNIVLEDGTPLNNVWLTLLQASGVKVESHGDSTGTIKALMA